MAEPQSDNVFRALNERIRLLSTRFHAFDEETETIPFVCECAVETCFAHVELTLADYDELLAAGDLALAPGHSAAAIGAESV